MGIVVVIVVALAIGVIVGMMSADILVTERIKAMKPMKIENIILTAMSDNAYLPKRSNKTDAGADLSSPIDTVVKANSCEFIDLEIALQIPKGYAGMIYARSGLGSKHGITPRNCVGIIDSDYRGNVGIMVRNDSDEDFKISRGDRIAQIVIQPVDLSAFVQVNELTDTERGFGGFGSTGK